MIALPAITLPAGTLRRSWLKRASRQARVGFEMAGLVRQLDPALQPNPFDALECYETLVRATSKRFPIFGYWTEDIEDVSYVFHQVGIQVDSAGYSPDSGGAALAFTAADLGLFDRYDPHPNIPVQKRVAEVFDGLGGVDLTWWAGPIPQPEGGNGLWRNFKLKPPRGRAWTGRWAALPELCDYLMQRTGNPWLDYASNDLDEGGMEMPEWNMDEIRALEKAWKVAKASLDRLNALAGQIDDDGVRGLRFLDRVLRREAQALQAITHPKGGKTLAEIWS